ncbi:MAG: toprim domain-containing protein [Nitrospirae bacterium]|nr:toprim domain-containing protein [Nitrospirota bacterium]
MNIQRNGQLTDNMERASRLREIFEILCERNKDIPVIVEGKRDALALRELGLQGEILTLHSGQSIYDFCEEISEKFHRVIILLDWDEKGESLNKALCSHLNGQWEEFSAFRELLKILCQKEIQDIESIPKLIRRLEADETGWQ